LLIAFGEHVAQRVLGGTEDQVHVAVNQSWQDGRIAQIEDLRARRELTGGRHSSDQSGIDKNGAIALNAAIGGAVDQSTSTNDDCPTLHRE
jgi:hypothetical protein